MRGSERRKGWVSDAAMAKVKRVACEGDAWIDLPASCVAEMSAWPAFGEAKVRLQWYSEEEEGRQHAEGGEGTLPRVVLRGHVLEASAHALHVSAGGLFARVSIRPDDPPPPPPGEGVCVHATPARGHQNLPTRRSLRRA